MHQGKELQHERLVFFSDAVFAIAITLLIIDIRLPHLESRGDIAIVNGLLSVFPHYIGFFVSFFVIGRFWVGHHRIFGLIGRHDDRLVWRNLIFLMTIAFMPFPTSVVSEYGTTRAAVMFYAIWLTSAGIANRSIVNHILHTPQLLHGPLTPQQLRDFSTSWVPIAIGLSSFAGACFHPVAGLMALMLSPIGLGLFNRWLHRHPLPNEEKSA